MILKKKVFGSAMLAAAIMSAGTCTAMAAPQQENTAIEAELRPDCSWTGIKNNRRFSERG